MLRLDLSKEHMIKYIRREGGKIAEVYPFNFPGSEEIDSESLEFIAHITPKYNYKKLRREEYGTVESQLEYLVENGLEALKSRNLAIKAKYPKNDA